MSSNTIIVVNRDVFAMLVPSGARVMLHQGTEVVITQALGNSFTVNVYGNLARIDAKDADALGKEVRTILDDLPEGASIDDKVWAQLHTVYDPEIPVNIVDLGLVYRCEISPVDVVSQDAQAHYAVHIDMTLTAPGCGMGPVIINDVREKVEAIPEVQSVELELVFDPPWSQERMSDIAKLELGVL